jgi:SET domain-containing protein
MSKVLVKNSKIQGRGVFAKRDIARGRVIEVSPVLILSANDSKKIANTSLVNYHYEWGKGTYALAMGAGSLFNHSYKANAQYYMNYNNDTISFYAVRDIKKGEEIFINYNGNHSSSKKVWFDKNAVVFQ